MEPQIQKLLFELAVLTKQLVDQAMTNESAKNEAVNRLLSKLNEAGYDIDFLLDLKIGVQKRAEAEKPEDAAPQFITRNDKESFLKLGIQISPPPK